MIAAGSVPRPRVLAVRGHAGVRLVLGSLFAVSVLARAIAALWHTQARYLPDEYIYASLSRSLLHGRLEVRGHAAHFPALLQPILAAPMWALLPVYDAYRAVQFENAVAVSLVVIPVWLLARDLGLSARTGYLVCGYALVVPMLAWVPVTISDFIAYPLVIAAVAAAVRSLNAPARRRQVLFLVFALLATAARVEYFVLVPAYIVGALVVERRQAIRRHALVFAGVAPALVAVVVGLTGFYAFGAGSFGIGILRWIPLQMYFLALVSGAVIAPGAVAALVRPQSRPELAFGAVAGSLTVFLLVESSVYASHDGRFRERYLFALLPLAAVAFGVHLRNLRPQRWIVLGVALCLIVAAPRVIMSTYTSDAPHYDSQSISAAWWLQQHLGAAGSSALVAGFVTVCSALAIGIAFRGVGRGFALPIAIGFALVTMVAAVYVDVSDAPTVTHPTWIDDAVHGAGVTAVVTPGSPRVGTLKQLYFNPSVDSMVRMDGADRPDSYATEQTTVGARGVLRGTDPYFVFDGTTAQASFTNARTVATHGAYTLFHATGTPHFRQLLESRLESGMLLPRARLRVWPSSAGEAPPRVAFTLSRKASAPTAALVELNGRRFTIGRGRSRAFACTADRWPLDLTIFSPSVVFDADGPVTVRLTHLRVGHARAGAGTRCSAA